MIEQVCSQDKFTIFGEMARSKAQLQHTECSIDFASLHSSKIMCVFQGNITTCGIVGAYAVVLAVDAYIYTSLSYITLNILKRLLNNTFSAVFTDVPFQTIGEYTSECQELSKAGKVELLAFN